MGMNKKTDQLEMAITIAAVASKASQSIEKTRAVMGELESVTDVNGRIALIRTLGKIG